mgnify:CR=1 FL=1
MRLLILLFFLIFLTNCSKPKTVLICGDHICVNKKEAQQYFEENLSLEVKIIKKEKSDELIDLVELNLKENSDGNKKVSLLSKASTKEKLKDLSNKEIIQIKKDVKKKIKEKKLKKRNIEKKKFNKVKEIENKTQTNDQKTIIKENVNKQRINVVDVCTILEKCSIDEISKYLLDQGRKKDYPDITIRE